MSKQQLVKQAQVAIGVEFFTIGSRYAYLADETGEWYWVTTDDMKYALDCRKEYGSDAYSHWCSGASQSTVAQSTLAKYGLI